MTADDRKAWAHAAYMTIGDVEPDALRRAAQAARETADHPAKVVPAIVAALRAERERERIASLNRIERPMAQLVHKPAPIPHDETQAILAEARRAAAERRAAESAA